MVINKTNDANHSGTLIKNNNYVFNKTINDLNIRGSKELKNKNTYDIKKRNENASTLNIYKSDLKKEKDNQEKKLKEKNVFFDRCSDKFSPKSNILTQYKNQKIKNIIETSHKKLLKDGSKSKENIQPSETKDVLKDGIEYRSDFQTSKKIVDLFNTTKEVNNVGLSENRNVFLTTEKNEFKPNPNSSYDHFSSNKNQENPKSSDKIFRNLERNNRLDDYASDVLNNIEINDKSKPGSKDNKLINNSKENFSFNNKIDQTEDFDSNIHLHLNQNGLLNNILQNININNASKSRNIKKNAEMFSQSKNCSSNTNNKNNSYQTQLMTQINNLKQGILNSTSSSNNYIPELSNNGNKVPNKSSDPFKKDKFLNPQNISQTKQSDSKNSNILQQIIMNNSNNLKPNLTRNNGGNNHLNDSTKIVNPTNHTYINMNLNLNINLEMDSKNFVKTEVCEKNPIEKSSKTINSSNFYPKPNNSLAANKKSIANNNNKINANNDINPYNRSFQGSALKNYQNNTSQQKNSLNKIIKKAPENINQDSFGIFNYVNNSLGKIVENENRKILLTANYDNKDKNNPSGEKNIFNKQTNYLLNVKSLANKNFKEKSKLDFYSNKTSYLKTSTSNNKSTQMGVKSLIYNDSQLSMMCKNSVITSDNSQNENNRPIVIKGKKN